MDAVKMMKNERADEAVECLQRAYMKYKNNPEPAYNVEMALVEILISQVCVPYIFLVSALLIQTPGN